MEKIKAMEHKCTETYTSIVIVFIRKESIWFLGEKIMSLSRERKSDRQIKNEGPENQSATIFIARK